MRRSQSYHILRFCESDLARVGEKYTFLPIRSLWCVCYTMGQYHHLNLDSWTTTPLDIFRNRSVDDKFAQVAISIPDLLINSVQASGQSTDSTPSPSSNRVGQHIPPSITISFSRPNTFPRHHPRW